jgi:fido (protein-threonine AMPylation protein)
VRHAEPPRFTRSPHLVDLVAETERLAGLVRAADRPARARLAGDRRDEATVATLRLDGSTLTAVPPPATLAEAGGTPGASTGAPSRSGSRTGTWLDAMDALEDAPDEELHALEVLAARAGLAADDLADALLSGPEAALRELHARLTGGLVAPERAGAPRTTGQAVHDASVGRILYFASSPEVIPSELALLGSWIASTGAREHGLILSGILHLELLRIHPFDAANGRLARTAARLVLRARGLDPDGLAAPEPVLAADPLGYYEEVARTARRRDATIWLERWGEAVTAGLRASVRALGGLEEPPPRRAEDAVRSLGGEGFTVADYRSAALVGPEDARADLQALLDAGRIRRVVGSRGLRFAHGTSAGP